MEGHGGGPLLGVAWLKLGSQVGTKPAPDGRGWLLLNDDKKGRNDTPPGNPELKTLNPEQYQKLKIKNQNYNSKIKKLLF